MIDVERANELIRQLTSALATMSAAALATDRDAYLAARVQWLEADNELRAMLPPVAAFK